MIVTQQIIAEVMTWPGVAVGPSERGEFVFRLGRWEIGHLFGDTIPHFGFRKEVWAELVEEGRVRRQPDDYDGWASRRIENETDVREVIELLRLNYDRIVARNGSPADSQEGRNLCRRAQDIVGTI